MSDAEIKITLPAVSDDDISNGLRSLTAAIESIDEDVVAHGFLGGEHGYGADFENDVFVMRPFYWGDCDCGFPEREREFSRRNNHSPACYQTELRAEIARYDEESGYKKIEDAVFGGHDRFFAGMDVETSSPAPGVTVSIMTPREDDLMEHWRAADDKRDKFKDELYARLCSKYGLPKRGCAIHCTCDYEDKWRKFIDANGHKDCCSLVLPNFRHKASGFEVRWYKYIGRDMEASGKCDWPSVLNECLESLREPLRPERADTD